MGFAFRSSIIGVGGKNRYSSVLITDHHPNRSGSQSIRVSFGRRDRIPMGVPRQVPHRQPAAHELPIGAVVDVWSLLKGNLQQASKSDLVEQI
jgi:hypothetical protein